MEVKMIAIMMTRLMSEGKEENIGIKEEEGMRLQMMSRSVAVKTGCRKRRHKTAAEEKNQLEQKSLLRKRQTSIIHCLQEQVQKNYIQITALDN